MARGALFTSDVRLWLQLMSTPIVGSLCKLLPAFRSRMLGNPRFLMVLGIEEAIGVAAKWSAEKSSRKENFWKVEQPSPRNHQIVSFLCSKISTQGHHGKIGPASRAACSVDFGCMASCIAPRNPHTLKTCRCNTRQAVIFSSKPARLSSALPLLAGV